MKPGQAKTDRIGIRFTLAREVSNSFSAIPLGGFGRRQAAIDDAPDRGTHARGRAPEAPRSPSNAQETPAKARHDSEQEDKSRDARASTWRPSKT